jgi:hypothetical protein
MRQAKDSVTLNYKSHNRWPHALVRVVEQGETVVSGGDCHTCINSEHGERPGKMRATDNTGQNLNLRTTDITGLRE